MTRQTRCNAKKKRGFCRRDAGWGTNHPGRGRCKDHETVAKAVAAELPLPRRIHALADDFKRDKDPYDLRDEIAMLRAAVALLLEDHEVVSSFVKAVPALNQLINSIGRLVQRLHEIEVGRRYVVRVDQVQHSLREITAIVVQYIDDPDSRAEVAKRIGAIAIDGEAVAPPETKLTVKDQEIALLASGREPPEA